VPSISQRGTRGYIDGNIPGKGSGKTEPLALQASEEKRDATKRIGRDSSSGRTQGGPGSTPTGSSDASRRQDRGGQLKARKEKQTTKSSALLFQ